jgi:nitrite reductase (NADH) small subunit
MPTPHRVCNVSELPPGQRKIIDIHGRSIGVFNLDGSYHALRNVCPHQLAPLCLGKVTGTTAPAPPGEYRWERDGRIIRCPWHGWEFDITTGRSVFNPHKLRVKTYAVTVERDAACATCDEDPAVETYPVTIDDGVIIVHV